MYDWTAKIMPAAANLLQHTFKEALAIQQLTSRLVQSLLQMGSATYFSTQRKPNADDTCRLPEG
jgi:hypothetical protein